ncbi:hypothetical protein QTP86_011544 [Hemibagrus guttatus]|nr:hypothetical protein QTP86_011544 [Hemibagrus guttatus]
MRIVSTNFIPDRSRPGLTTTAIGAVDLQGAGGNWATVGRRSRGGRRVRRQREKKKGKGRELADMMERRKVDILCVQETRWKGSKARSIGAGFKLFYYGVDSKRNGVGVVLKEELVGCELEEKERFWSELDEVMESIPTGERVVIGADFNGHVGEGNTGDEEVMGKFGVKERNLEGQMVVDFAKRMDMAVVNTYFQKREEHRVTYKSGGRRTQKRRQKLRQALGGQVLLPDDWETTAEVIRETGRKDSIQRKRLAKKKWDMDRTEENRQEYKELQRRVKREVSKAKQKAYDELYTRLDTREGEKDLYRVLTSEKSIQRRWKEYFEELMNEENEREKRVEGVNSVEQKVDKIRKDEVRKALKRMKSGKAVGPDDIPVEVWKCLGEAAVEFLTSLFNRVLENLEKAYDRVPREELWYCMRKSGVAEKYVRVVQDMYERSRTVVRCAVGQTEEFNVEVGLHQGSALSPFLFAMVMDQLSEEVRQESPWTMMFADDIVICSESREQVEENLERWRFALERRGMKVSRSKTEYMCVNEREGSGTVRLQGEEVKKVQEFKYLGSTVQSNGECGKEYGGMIREVFQYPAWGKDISLQLMELCQGFDTVADYAIKFRTLAAQSGWNEAALWAVFREGLNPALQIKLACREEAASLTQFVAMAIRLDNLLRQHQAGAHPPVSAHLRMHSDIPRPREEAPEPMQLGRSRLSEQEHRRRGRIKLTHQTELLEFQVGLFHREHLAFYVTSSPVNPVILGFPWLQRHDPQISWRMGELVCWSEACIKDCLLETVSRPCRTSLVEDLAPMASGRIPRVYEDFREVFSEERATRLLSHQAWDCPRGRVYPPSLPETRSMEEYIEEALAEGHI